MDPRHEGKFKPVMAEPCRTKDSRNYQPDDDCLRGAKESPLKRTTATPGIETMSSVLLVPLLAIIPLGVSVTYALACVTTGLAVVWGVGPRNHAGKYAGWLLFGFGIGVIGLLGCQRLLALHEDLRIAAARTKIAEIERVCEKYHLDNGQYPITLEAMLVKDQNGKGPYLSGETIRDPWGNVFLYERDGSMGRCGNCLSHPDIYCTLSDGRMIGNFR